jgi:hypothetical protein
MAVRSLPGLGLRGYWTVGSGGWGADHDPDTRLLSILCQCRVLSRTTALPATPSDGDIYLVPATAGSNANEIAARDNGVWEYIISSEGFVVFVENENQFVFWDAVAGEWVPTNRVSIFDRPASYLLPANLPCGSRQRSSAAAANTVTVRADSVAYYPVGFWLDIEQAGAGKTTVVAGAGVTVRTAETLTLKKQYSVAKLLKIGPDEWVLSGELELL